VVDANPKETLMNSLRRAYVDMYVATAKVRRRADEAQAEFERWTDRIALAKRVGQPELAHLARQRAIRAAEREVRLRAFLATQTDRIEYIQELAR
jgi:hypothetical protein